MKYYLAYGSNLNCEQMHRRCPDAFPAGTAEIKDYKLVFRRGFLTIEPSKGDKVPVGIWAISDRDEKNLDRYEGFPTFYYKKDFPVSFAGGPVHNCMAYIMTDGHPLQVPSDPYFYTVLRGYRDFGLGDRSQLMDAYERVKWPEDYTTDSTTVFDHE